MGAAGTPLLRLLPPDYADGISALAGAERPSPREVSNLVSAQGESVRNPLAASDYLWQWGQFLDHDLDLSDGVDPPEPEPIPVPAGDPWFDPGATGSAEIPFNRSLYDPASGSGPDRPRQQLNEISGWIDASNVYGSDEVRAQALRAPDGSGRLRTSPGDLLPFNEEGLPNAGGPDPTLFLAGDVRSNEQVGLTALHTLFVREHNRLADRLRREHPSWDGERIYQKARQLVGAELQVVSYREFLPALLGRDALPPYRGYDPTVDAGISNAFATAAYRFGHSALSSLLLRIDARGREIPAGHLALRDAFFAPERISEEGGIEPLLRGLAAQRCQRVDVLVVDDVRNFLFGAPGAGGFDLASLNIQRGRDHGLPGYNDAREALGLGRAQSFAEVSSDPDTRSRLAAAYASPDEIDLWVGGLAEDPVEGGHVGPLVRRILVDQFTALRDGDRFWYARVLSRNEVRELEATRLSDLIRRNTSIGRELADDVFHVRKRHRRGRR
jgi:peroxidase